MINIWIITSYFPYGLGEQFLETEIKFWAENQQATITLLPMRTSEVIRPLPCNIAVDLCLSRDNKRPFRHLKAIKSIFSRILWEEILWLRKKHILCLNTFFLAWRTATGILRTYALMKQKLRQTRTSVVGYSYWFDVAAYALALLRREDLIDYLVTRAHGFDVYEELRSHEYMPFKRQFVHDFDEIFAISEAGKTYLHERYNTPLNVLKINRLGVLVGDKLSLPSTDNTINLVSVSFCVSIKRIDRIIHSIAIAAQLVNKDVSINWTHIGGGELFDTLRSEAEHVLGSLHNVRFQFLGHLSNTEVIRYYETNSVDVFINTSESEGLPVSIMEAMSFGIPVIAPSIGGIPELVNHENGWLLSAQPTLEEIAQAIRAVQHYKNARTRQAAREAILRDYNAEKNYRSFVNGLIAKVARTT